MGHVRGNRWQQTQDVSIMALRRGTTLPCLLISFTAIMIVLYYHTAHDLSTDTVLTQIYAKKISSPPDISPVQQVHLFAPVQDPDMSEDLFVKPAWERKYFIYDCSNYGKGLLNGACGGFADRQEGIVAAYLISQILRRKFKLKMNIPCDISYHLQPHKHNWVFNSSEVEGLSHIQYKKLDGNAWKLRDQIANGLDLEKEFPHDVTYFTVNQEMVNFLLKHPSFVNLKWAQNKTAADIYNIVLRRLFHMAPILMGKFTSFQITARNKGKKLVCAQIRVRGNPTIPHDDYVSFTDYKLNVTVVWDFLSQYNDSDRYTIFVATDSDKVRQDAKHLFPDVLQDVPGNIVHVDRDKHSHEYACEGFAKVILDEQTMTTCDVLFLTDGGLGRIASMLRGTDDGLFCMTKNSQGNTDYKRCHFSDKTFFPSYW